MYSRIISKNNKLENSAMFWGITRDFTWVKFSEDEGPDRKQGKQDSEDKGTL